MIKRFLEFLLEKVWGVTSEPVAGAIEPEIKSRIEALDELVREHRVRLDAINSRIERQQNQLDEMQVSVDNFDNGPGDDDEII